jgi:hypothetical protein
MGRERAESTDEPSARQWRDEVFLVVWAALVLYFSCVYVMFQAVRHVLPAIVPVCLLAVRVLQRSRRSAKQVGHAALAVCLAAQVLVCIWVAIADCAYADVYRRYAANPQPILRSAEGEVWFMGNWGWQHYARRQGWRLMATHGALPRPGDLLIIPERAHKGKMPAGLGTRLELVSERDYSTPLKMFTMNGFSGASFYAVVGANLPYLYSPDDRLETFRIYRVGPQQ